MVGGQGMNLKVEKLLGVKRSLGRQGRYSRSKITASFTYR
jgi:hypothetical protein